MQDTHLQAKTYVLGSDAIVREGSYGTKSKPGAFNPDLFNSNRSIILGNRDGIGSRTVAEWRIPLDPDVANDVEHGFLIIAAERTHSGLHSFYEGPRATVYLNNNQKDVIMLYDMPAGHKSYFHRPHDNRSFDEFPFNGCSTVYSWPVYKEDLYSGMEQVVKVVLDDKILWDVDYVGLLLIKKKKHLSGWLYTLLVAIIAAIVGALITLLLTPN